MTMITECLHRLNDYTKIVLYKINGCRPWTKGYLNYRDEYIARYLGGAENECFITGQLPKGYGKYLDERVVEYPWLFSKINLSAEKLLDAGSVLNYNFILKNVKLRNKAISIVTLEPEGNCFWNQRVSYEYNDLRELPYKNNWFDTIACISTLEHIGMDNSIYSENKIFKEQKTDDYLKVIIELKRILKPNSKLFVTVPYGRYQNFGWYQQFNAPMIDKIIQSFIPSKINETYFCYENNGWSFCDKSHCTDFTGFDIHKTKYRDPTSTLDYDADFAACSRAIAALELWK